LCCTSSQSAKATRIGPARPSESVDPIELIRHDGTDPHVLGRIWDHYRDRLRRVVRLRLDRRLQGRLDSDDVLQEAFLDFQPRAAEYAQHPDMPIGAMLHVRYPDQYVLIQKFPDGRPFATGSNGERSWVIPPGGATVRVSRDPMRFRGPVPGHQHGIPFVNLRSDLVQLLDAYTVSPLGPNAAGQRGQLAVKKSSDYRGPNRVELWYDADTGVIHRMVFAGMPKARGGPDSVAVELVDQRDLAADFFKHQSHQAPDRRVVEED
jgi:hypothetical protein